MIGRLPVFDPELLSSEQQFSSSVRLAGGRGWRLAAARNRFGTCVTLRVRDDDLGCVAYADVGFDPSFQATVSCTPRLALIVGALPKGTNAVRVVLRGGRTLRARVLRVPRRYGGGLVWVASVPRTAQVRARRTEGPSSGHTRFRLLPATAQCGYTTSGSFPIRPTPVTGG